MAWVYGVILPDFVSAGTAIISGSSAGSGFAAGVGTPEAELAFPAGVFVSTAGAGLTSSFVLVSGLLLAVVSSAGREVSGLTGGSIGGTSGFTAAAVSTGCVA